MALQSGQYSSANGLSHTHWQAKSSAQTQSPIGMRKIKPLHIFWKGIALFNMFIKNIHVSLCSIKLCLENGPGKKCIWKRICQIHQIRWIKYKYKYMAWNLIKYKYKYKYAVFVFVFANTNMDHSSVNIFKLQTFITDWLNWNIDPWKELNKYKCNTVKPVYNDHLMGYFSAFWSSSRWSRATRWPPEGRHC